MSDLESNVEPFTPEVLARRLIEQWGDQAETQASLNADHFYAHNDNAIAKIWHKASKIIAAVRPIHKAAGGNECV
jgi:quinol monooxygenase YgiN